MARSIINLAALAATLSLSGCGNTLPACESPDTMQRVVEIINNGLREMASDNPMLGYVLRESGLQVVSVTDGKTIYADENIHACIGKQNRRDGSKVSIGYTVQWSNRQTGEAIIEIVNSGELKRQYGKPEATAQTDPEPAPVPLAIDPEPEPVQQEVRPPTQPETAAQTTEPSSLLDQCMASSIGESQYADCAQEEYKRQDVRLNASYKAALNSSASPALRAAQRAWIKFRDATCAGVAGDEYPRAEFPLCMAEATQKRAAELEAMVPRQE